MAVPMGEITRALVGVRRRLCVKWGLIERKEGWRLSAKLDRIGADLEKARKKRAEWDAKVKDLERRYREEENSEIHEMVHAANLNPEQLSELLRMFAADMAPKPDTINTMNEEETQNEI